MTVPLVNELNAATDEAVIDATSGDKATVASVIPKKIGRYRIAERLGEGGMGVVHKAHDTRLHDRTVAVKFLRLDTNNSQEIAERIARFDREGRILLMLEHPNIVKLFDYGEVESNDLYKLYMAMEYIDGIAVDELLREKGQLQFGDTLHLIKQTLSALEYAHRHGVVHRDLKPSNIMLHKEGWVKVLDFGISKVMARTDTQWSQLTQGRGPGTAGYMSPEQIHGDHIDHRSDIFSLGLIIYEMLAGDLPDNEIRYGTKPPQLESIQPDLPKELDTIIAKMLSLKPEDRYQHAGEIMEALNTLD